MFGRYEIKIDIWSMLDFVFWEELKKKIIMFTLYKARDPLEVEDYRLNGTVYVDVF